jgi:hypothetical protein
MLSWKVVNITACRLIYWTWKHSMHKAMLLFRVKLNDKCGHPRPAESSTNLTVIHIHRSFYQLIIAVTSLPYKLSRCVLFLTHRSVFLFAWLLLPSVVEPSEDRVQHVASNMAVVKWMCCCLGMFHRTQQIQRAAPTVCENTHIILRDFCLAMSVNIYETRKVL